MYSRRDQARQIAKQMGELRDLKMTEFVLPFFVEAAREEREVEEKSDKQRCLKQLEEALVERTGMKVFASGRQILAVLLVAKGWMQRFVTQAIIASAMNLKEKLWKESDDAE